MRSMLSKLVVAGLVAVTAIGGAIPAASATVLRPNVPHSVDPIITGKASSQASQRSDVQNVQYRDERRWHRDRRDYRERRHYRDRRHWDRRHHHRRHRDHYRRGPSIHFGWGPTYRYVEPRRVPRHVRPRVSSSHVNWCYNRYRSYRASDNTFQPNHGPRRQCYSPYI